MASRSSIFEREVLLDIAVNIVPMVVIAVLAGLFLFDNHWPHGALLGRVLQFGLLVVPFGGLAFLTYVAARKMEIEEDDIKVGP